MTDVRIRPEVVSLLLDIDDMDEFAKGRLTHMDGRPFTDDEFQLAGTANAAEMRACADYSERVSAMYEERCKDTQRAVEIMEPYFDRLGPEGTVSDVRKICTPAEDAELGEIFERTAPDGYIVLS